jgi:peptidoglycan/xylan/chitin deacetylase (PgdA/CDA1 family)
MTQHPEALSTGTSIDNLTRALAYHEFALAGSKDVYEMRPAVFEEQIVAVGQAAERSSTSVAFTFDDAHVSQLELAAPLLEKHAIRGLFFVTTDWVGIKHQVASWTGLRNLIRQGHSIGSHGLTHQYLSNCTPVELKREVAASRMMLEDRLGIEVRSISAPGGRWNMDVLAACLDAGYQDIFTSEPNISERRVTNANGKSLTIHGRLVVRRSMSTSMLTDYVAGKSLVTARLRSEYKLKQWIKLGIGDNAYRSIWRGLLRDLS